jgi:hypothetical protein
MYECRTKRLTRHSGVMTRQTKVDSAFLDYGNFHTSGLGAQSHGDQNNRPSVRIGVLIGVRTDSSIGV